MLDAAKLSSAKFSRAVFPRRDSSGMSVEEPTVSGSLTMHEQWRAANVCDTHLVYIAVSRHSLLCILMSYDHSDHVL